VHLAFQGRTWNLQVHLQFSRAHRAPGVIEVHLQSAGAGAPWEWQVRPVSNKRMPGAAPGDLQVRLASPGARCAWHLQHVLQVHLMRALLVKKARLSGRY
jgi:hypothetical protein